MNPEHPEIPVMKPHLVGHENVIKYLAQMDKTRIYSNRGPLLKEFEKRLAEYFSVNVEQVVVCANATIGIEGSLATQETTFYYSPVYTFSASLLALINARKSVEILDIREDNWQLDISTTKPANDKGLLVVLPFGSKCNMETYLGYESVVVDAAASIAQYRSGLSDIPSNFAFVFSLHATKVLGIGEGGVVVFGNKTQAQSFRSWINFGFNGSRNSETAGSNGKLSEIAAAYGLATLDSLELEFIEWKKQRQLADKSNQSLGVSPLAIPPGLISPYRIVEFADPNEKKVIASTLTSRGIQTRDWWSLGLHKMKAFKNITPGQFRSADRIASKTLGLPFYRDLTEEHFNQIHNLIENNLS